MTADMDDYQLPAESYSTASIGRALDWITLTAAIVIAAWIAALALLT